MYLIASYPRSGNHFVRYIVEYLTKRPTLGTGDARWMMKNDPPIYVRLGEPRYYRRNKFVIDDAIAYKKHGGSGKFNKIVEADKENELILIVRNYKEVFVRHGGGFNRDPVISGMQKEYIAAYVELLEMYDGWKHPKHLIYYEDLISDTPGEVRRLAEFLGQDAVVSHESYVESLARHKKRSLRACQDQLSGGDKKIFYSTRLSDQWKKRLDDHLIESHPIAQRYLVRYLEEPVAS